MRAIKSSTSRSRKLNKISTDTKQNYHQRTISRKCDCTFSNLKWIRKHLRNLKRFSAVLLWITVWFDTVMLLIRDLQKWLHIDNSFISVFYEQQKLQFIANNYSIIRLNTSNIYLSGKNYYLYESEFVRSNHCWNVCILFYQR